MRTDIFENSKNVFLDAVNSKDFIKLERVSIIYQSFKESLKKPIKMIMLYGKPGAGKSMLLSKLYNDIKESQKIYLYKTPILDESEFFKTIAQDLYDMKYNNELNFTQFMKVVENSEQKEVTIPIIMLDEAQLYSTALMEKIRLLSDTRKVKFVIALHKTEKEDLIAKEHFQTRIWENIRLDNASASELQLYIQKKLMLANNLDTATMFTQKAVNLIYKFTDGNYRETNKLIFTIFEIYTYYASNDPSRINSKEISKKIIEMSAIHTGLLNA
ncbi:ATP-binding protein [Sulfurimonas sp.]|uniref:ATP-binding protein n=1 Tax=Sulfurimonas sp. TaxID=2022749 RepID=UPI0025E7A2B0|nr:ATP-binding protein [Sulfurimonas sp.]